VQVTEPLRDAITDALDRHTCEHSVPFGCIHCRVEWVLAVLPAGMVGPARGEHVFARTGYVPPLNEGARAASSTPPREAWRLLFRQAREDFLAWRVAYPHIERSYDDFLEEWFANRDAAAVLPADPPPPAYRELHGWAVEEAVTCVACPDCAFTFDALHEDTGGGYSCPACSEIAK
jgi:hypothetical protein